VAALTLSQEVGVSTETRVPFVIQKMNRLFVKIDKEKRLNWNKYAS